MKKTERKKNKKKGWITSNCLRSNSILTTFNILFFSLSLLTSYRRERMKKSKQGEGQKLGKREKKNTERFWYATVLCAALHFIVAPYSPFFSHTLSRLTPTPPYRLVFVITSPLRRNLRRRITTSIPEVAGGVWGFGESLTLFIISTLWETIGWLSRQFD